jgi:hypothetical protein
MKERTNMLKPRSRRCEKMVLFIRVYTDKMLKMLSFH